MNPMTKLFAALGLCVFAAAASANATEFEATDNRATTQICMAAVEGNTSKLRQTIKASRLSKQYVANKVKCNELAIVDFVEVYGENVESINNYITAGRYSSQRSDSALANR